MNDPLPERVTALVAVSYGATGDRLTHSSREVVNEVARLQKRFPEAKVFWGSFSKSPTEGLETAVKRYLLGRRGWFVGKVSSSTDECEAVRRTLIEIGVSSSSIVVVAEECHARRCKMVWEHFFPNSEIYFQSIPAEKAQDPENPMIFQRSWRVWLTANIVGWVIFKMVGIGRMAKWNFSQPA